MRRRLPLAPSLLLIALVGCGRSVAPVKPEPPPPPQAAIEAVTERDGAVLVELGLGARHGVAVGDFLHAFGDEPDHRRLKGTLQVSELIGDDRCVARLIALNDRGDPLRTGDRAKVVADLAAEDPVDIAPPSVAAKAGRAALRPRVVAVDPNPPSAEHPAAIANPVAAPAPSPDLDADDARFAAVREHYQRELNGMQARHDAEAAELRRQLAARTEEDAQHEAHALADRDLAQRAAIASLKADLDAEHAKQLAAENAARDQRIDQVAAERDGLKAQVETLLREQDRLKLDAEKARAAAVAADERRRKELRAEVETREVLQARLTEIEKKLDGKPGGVAPVLVNDPERHETVLQQLDRVQGELAGAQVRLDATAKELDAAKARQQELEKRAADADQRAADADALRTQLADAHARIDALTGDAKAQRLARLEAERSLFDLAARVLRLKGDGETATLQDRVRTTLAALEPARDATGPDAPRERAP